MYIYYAFTIIFLNTNVFSYNKKFEVVCSELSEDVYVTTECGWKLG